MFLFLLSHAPFLLLWLFLNHFINKDDDDDDEKSSELAGIESDTNKSKYINCFSLASAFHEIVANVSICPWSFLDIFQSFF